MSFSTIRVTIGRVILVAGVLVLLFIPYLLWGTGLITAQAQNDLRQQFLATQRMHHATVVLHPPTKPPAVLTIAPTIAPPATGAPVGILSIPKIAVSVVIVEGTSAEQLRSGPGHYPGTPLPGEAGNVAIAGHRTTYLHPFYDLNELTPGDPINILTGQGLFQYRVTSSRAVDPTDVAVVAPTASPMLTLTTCNPKYSASQRLVVQATLVSGTLVGASAAPTSPNASAGSTHGVPPVQTPHQKHWWQAVAWGILVAALATATWVFALRLRGGRRTAVVVAGIVLWLGAVFLFFGALAPLLPASF